MYVYIYKQIEGYIYVSLSIYMYRYTYTYKEVAGLVLCMSDVEQIMEQSGSWQPIATVLSRVVDSSMLGMKMFGWLLTPVLAESMQIFTDKCIDESLSGEVNTASIEQCAADCLGEAVSLGALAVLGHRRDIKVSYRGMQLTVQDIRGYEEELTIRIAAKLKSRCVGAGVPLLVFESSVLGPPQLEAKDAPKVQPEVLKDFKMARVTANEMLKKQVLSGELVKEMITTKGQICVQVDKTFKIELALLDTACGEGGVARMQDLVLEALPTTTRSMTMQHSQQQLAMLSQQALH